MRILYVTTIGSTMGFFKSFIKSLLDEGHIVEIATNENGGKVSECYREWGCEVHQIDTSRSPLRKGNLIAIRQIKTLVEQSKYDIVHCHTPIAAMCTRIACQRIRKSGTKVFYTAHGFHFYKGAPLKNWLLYYPVEWLCSWVTDVLITINQEDYERAKKHLHSKKTHYVPGVGVDIDKFSKPSASREELRIALKIPQNAIVITSVGELNANKNHIVIINALSAIKDKDIIYLIAGEGNQKTFLQNEINKRGLHNRIVLLGHRNDIAELYNASDICAFPSIREGLPLAVIEGMAAGLPLLISDNRGTRGLIRNGENGIVWKYNDVSSFARAIEFLSQNEKIRAEMGNRNRMLSKKFSKAIINSKMKEIYEDVRV